MTDIWDAKIYSQFLDLRTRPARDLLSAIPPDFQPKIIYDLGCGPGNSTIILKNRWPHAKIIGIDSSQDMIDQAHATYPEINFIKNDIANFQPKEKPDCIFANASLQWLNDHEILFPKLFNLLNANGVLAIQLPNNFHAPSHQIIFSILDNHSNWKSLAKNLFYTKLTKPLYSLPNYYDLFTACDTQSLQLWETEYFQEMKNYESIFDWVKGTGLRPILANMNEKDQQLFQEKYVNAISKKYNLQKNNKVLLPFLRIFMVASMLA